MPERDMTQQGATQDLESAGPLPEGVRAALRHRRRVHRARAGAALASVTIVALLSVVLSSMGSSKHPGNEYGPVRLAFDDPMLAALDGAGPGPIGLDREWSVGMVYREDWPGGL